MNGCSRGTGRTELPDEDEFEDAIRRAGRPIIERLDTLARVTADTGNTTVPTERPDREPAQ